VITIRLVIEGEVVLSRELDGIEERLRDLSGAWPAIVSTFRGIVARAFATEGASTGQAWKPLAERTQRDRKKLHFGAEHPILERYGMLRRSIATDQGLGFTTMTPTSLDIGTKVKYFKYHQSPKPRTKLPRRAMVLFTEQNRQDLVHPVRLWVTGRDPNGVRRARPAAGGAA
jgi:phage gpG-like protein